MRIFSGLGFALLAWPLAALAGQDGQASTEGDLLTLQRAVQIAVSDNPGLAQAAARAKALAEVSPQVGTLPDPTLSLGAVSFPTDTFSFTQEAMTQMQVGIGFDLPFPGKLGLREQKADLEARSAKYDADEVTLALIRKVRTAWWNLFYLDRAESIVKRNQDLLRELILIAETKYKTGQGMQSDVLLAQVELSKLLEIGIGLQASRRGQAAYLNSLLGRSSAEAVLPQQVDESLPAAPNAESLRDMARNSRPILSSARSAREAAHTRVLLAEQDHYPDFKLGAAYGFRQGFNPNGTPRADLTSLTLSMNLPIFSETKQDRALAQRKTEELQAQYELQDRVLQVNAEIEQALADYRSQTEQTSLLKTGIIPQASQSAASMLAAYQVDKVDFLNLIRAQVTLYNYQTQYWKALSSCWQAWARLEAAIGKPLAQQLAETNRKVIHE